MTNEELEKDLAIIAAITPGKWKYDSGITDDQFNPPERGKSPWVQSEQKLIAELRGEEAGFQDEFSPSLEEMDANGAFIEKAHERWPLAIQEIMVLKVQLERLAQACSLFEKNSADATELWEENRKLKESNERLKQSHKQSWEMVGQLNKQITELVTVFEIERELLQAKIQVLTVHPNHKES